MSNKKIVKLSLAGIFSIIILIFIYQLLWGKLFPFSPITIGFSKYELSCTIIYVQNGSDFNDFMRIDTLISTVENFHELNFIKKPKIYIFNDSDSYLSHSISKARLCAFQNGNLIISPWAIKDDKQNIISLDIYIKHELSHCLLFQNMGFIKAFRYPKWLLEGIATYSSNQMGTSWYPGKEETYSMMRNGNFMPPEYYETKNEDKINLNVKYRNAFMYSEFACIVEFLINKYGKDKFLDYTKGNFENSNHDEVFKKFFGITFEEFQNDFKTQFNK